MKDSQHNLMPIEPFVELAKRSRALEEEWVLRSLLALAVTNDAGLANAFVMRLRLRAVVELIDPFPFDIPSQEDFG